MDLAAGESLSTVIRRRQSLPETSQKRGVVGWEWSLPIIEQLLDVLMLAHERGIVHRDLKPDNIMVDLAGNAPDIKVLDFGIAKIMNEASEQAVEPDGLSGLTVAGSVIGTLQYMAPEQAAGDEVDGRVDLYATGVIFYQLITGRLPINAETMAKLIYAVTPPPPVSARDAAPPA
jgi:serine/threonine protein kinase